MLLGSFLNRLFVFGIVATQMTFVLGCGGGPSDPLSKIKKEPTGGVKGVIQIDGSPKSAVRVFAFKADNLPNGKVDPSGAGSANMTTTVDGGKFSFTTYAKDDGLLEGDYVLALFWNGDSPSMDLSPENTRETKEAAAFNRKYSNPAKSEIKFSAKKETPVDLGVLELKSK